MLKMVDGTGIIGVDMVCPLGGAVSPPQPPNFDKVEVEGVGSLMLPNSLKVPLERVELIGNSVQPTTTGKNLFDPKQLQGISGFTIEGNEITQSGYNVSTGKTLKQLCPEITPGTYILSANNGDFTGLFGITKPMYKKSAIEIVDEDLNGIVALVGNPNKTIKYTLQIEKGNTVTPYEPYTGLKPSPSPEYQQEIKNSGKWNEETQKYEIDIILNGSNLWKEDSMIRGHLTANGEIVYKEDDSSCIWTVVAPRDGKYAVRIEKESVGGLYFTRIFNDKTSEPYVRLNPGQKGVLTLKKGENKIQASSTSALRPIGNEKVMLSYDDQEPPTYEPYQEPQTLTLTSDRPITKWDKLAEQGGQYGWLYKHRIVNDLSALVKDSEPIYGKDGEKYFSVSLQNASLNYDRSKIYSEVGLSGKDSKIHYAPRPLVQSVVIYVSDTDTIMTAKEHMHYKVIYETIESQFVPLPESEQTQLRNLHSYDGTTNINIDSGEAPCGIKLTYRKEI